MHRPRLAALSVGAAALLLSACNGEAPAPDTTGEDTVAVTGQDDLFWDAEQLTAAAGTITVELTCEGAVNHNFTIDETGEEVVACDPGETDTGTVDLEAGTYTYVCTVPGHEERMRGTLTVE
jgi:plastocyanin